MITFLVLIVLVVAGALGYALAANPYAKELCRNLYVVSLFILLWVIFVIHGVDLR